MLPELINLNSQLDYILKSQVVYSDLMSWIIHNTKYVNHGYYNSYKLSKKIQLLIRDYKIGEYVLLDYCNNQYNIPDLKGLYEKLDCWEEYQKILPKLQSLLDIKDLIDVEISNHVDSIYHSD